MLFRWFVLRAKPRKPVHRYPARRVEPNAVSPDVQAPNYRPPTVHSTRMEDEFARLKRKERYNHYLHQLNQAHRELGEDIERVMSQPLHLGGDQHDAPTDPDHKEEE